MFRPNPIQGASRYQYQKTLSKPGAIRGIGVHSGKAVSVLLQPAPPNTGLIFRLLESGQYCPATLAYVRDGRLATTLCSLDGWAVSTVEHLLAALYGLGITNAWIDLSGGSELPILDGSSKPFVEMLLQAGVEIQEVETRWMVLRQEVRVQQGARWIEASPNSYPQMEVFVPLTDTLEEHHVFLPFQERFESVLAPARTFAKLSDLETLRQAGLIQGGTMDCAVVLDPEGRVINPEGTRFENECARHKLLDMVGDFALLGHFFWGSVRSYAPGHALNHAFLQEMLRQPDAWEYGSFSTLCPPKEYHRGDACL